MGLPSIRDTGGPSTTAIIGASNVTVNGNGEVNNNDMTSVIVPGSSAPLSADTGGGDNENGGGAGGGIGATCSTSADCTENRVCGGNPKVCRAVGTIALDESCTNASECASGFCSYFGVCVEGAIDGPCNGNSECQSGYCHASAYVCKETANYAYCTLGSNAECDG